MMMKVANKQNLNDKKICKIVSKVIKMDDIPAGLVHRTTSAIPRQISIRELHSKADDLQRVRDGELNKASGPKKFRTMNNSNGKKIESVKAQPQYNGSFENPYMAQSRNEKLARLIEERARTL